MAATISKKVNIGSGYVYDVILNESFPAEKTIANLKTWLDTAVDDDNRIGNIKGGFKTVCNMLPFSHSLTLVKNTLAGDYSNTLKDFVWVAISTLIISFAAAAVFKKKRCKKI